MNQFFDKRSFLAGVFFTVSVMVSTFGPFWRSRVPDSPCTGYAEKPEAFYQAPDGRWYAEPTLAD